MEHTEQVRHVVAAVEAGGGAVRVLGREEIAQRWTGLCDSFGVDGTGGSTWLWDAVESQASRQVADGVAAMSELARLVGARRCFVFFEDFFGPAPDDSAIGYHRPGHLKLSCVEIEGQDAVAAALGETFWEVTVAGSDYCWALMLNHHDYLVGIGDARAWVDDLPEDA